MSNGKCAFIPDGYTLEVTLPETEWYPEVKVEYRPAMIEERIRVSKKIGATKNTEDGVLTAEKIAREAMAAHVVSWGLELPIDATGMARLESHFSADLFNLVMGYKSLGELYRAAGKEPPEQPENLLEASEKN